VKGCDDCSDADVRYIHTLTVEKPGTATDASGQIDLDDDTNWITVGRIKANFVTKGGSESYLFKQAHAETDMILKSQSTTISRSIVPSWRLRFKGRKLNVVASDLINMTGKVVQTEVTERRLP
jgi:head-tail adaptor